MFGAAWTPKSTPLAVWPSATVTVCAAPAAGYVWVSP
jgi:hypothetical protein